MEQEKFKVSIIDFMPEFKKIEIGKYEDGSPACLGDVVEYHGETNWFISYRYGQVMIKQPGMIAMIGNEKFKDGDFSSVKKTNILGSGQDWLIIGYKDEPMYEKIKHLIQ